jgi:lambda family phage tail tape measure protein
MASTDPADFLRDAAERQRQLETLERVSQRFGQSLSNALTTSTSSGKQLDGVLSSIGSKLATSLGTNVASGLGNALSSGLTQAVQAFTSTFTLGSGAFPFAQGGVFSGGRVQPFAAGGIVSTPTYFPTATGLGLMGEAGPEAVMPLSRGADGRLGVTGSGGSTNINVTIQATDLDSFKRSETQISAALARAVARGRRAT